MVLIATVVTTDVSFMTHFGLLVENIFDSQLE